MRAADAIFARRLRRRKRAVSLVALLPVALGPVVVARYDLLPAALCS